MRLHHSLGDARQLGQRMFDLGDLHPEAFDFYLFVNAALVEKHAVLILDDIVAGPVIGAFRQL